MKRILSLLLVLIMVFAVTLPASALAASETDTPAYGDSGTVETPAIDENTSNDSENTETPTPVEETATPGNTDVTENPMVVEDVATPSDAALTLTPTEQSKLIAPPDFQPDDAAGSLRTMRTLLATQSERITNPNIVYTYSPTILNGAGPIIFTDSTTGMPAYCIDYNRSVPSPDSLDGENDFDPETIFDPTTYNGLKCLLLAGYPYETGNGLTAAEAQGCTQLAIWCWTYETMGYGLNAANYTAIPGKEHIYDYFKGLLVAARNQTWPELELSATDVRLMKNGDVLTGQTTVSWRNLNGGYSLDESKLPEGMTVTGYTGSDGDVLTFTAPLSFAGQSHVLNEILAGHDERSDLNLFWYDNKNPNQQRMAISVTDTATVATTASIAMECQGIGKIHLKKLSANDAPIPSAELVAESESIPLAGAVFGVFDAATNEKIGEITTDENGDAAIALVYGDYYLQELTAPAGFRLSDHKYPVHLDKTEITVIATNVKTSGNLSLYKADDKEKPLANAVFGVFNAATDEKVCELTTDENGTAFVSLPVGNFYLLELIAPEGFLKLDEKVPFSILDNMTFELSLTNTPLPKSGHLHLVKTGQEANVRLSGAVFGVYNADTDEKVLEVTTGENGEITAELPIGDFYLLELTAPAGYQKSSEKYSFVIKGNDTTELTVVNAPEPPKNGCLQLIKMDKGKTVFLSGAVFGVYNADTNEKIGELTTGTDGKASMELPQGNFYLLEQTAPAGYQLMTDKTSFTIKPSDTTTLTVENIKLPEPPKNGYLQLTKTEKGKNIYLGGAVFGIYNADTDEKIRELTTGTDGKASTELPEGRFYIKELIAPAGYQLVADKTSFTIKPTETVTLTVENPKIPEPAKTGYVKIIKRVEQTNDALKGAVFGIYRASDNEKVAELTTGTDGTVLSAPLNVGDYYLLELKAPSGYQLKSDKVNFTVKENQTTEIVFTNKPVTPDEPNPGKVVLIKKSEDTGKKLRDAIFGVYRASDDKLIGKLTTGSDGKASMELTAGKYYLLELAAPDGFQKSDKKTSFTIKDGETKEITLTNKPVEPEPGELTLIKKAEGTNKLLRNAEFAVYDSNTDKKVATLKTDSYGEATIELPEGDYYLREQKAPEGFELSKDKIIFSIKSGEQKTITVTNKPVKQEPTTGTLLLVKSAEVTGNRLAGAVFGVYNVSSNEKVAEIKTGPDGTATLELEPADYYLRELKAPSGYNLDSTKIPFTVSKAGVTVKVEVTNELETVVIPNENPPTGAITIPKTGETPPYANYTLAALCMCIAGVCGVILFRKRKQTA